MRRRNIKIILFDILRGVGGIEKEGKKLEDKKQNKEIREGKIREKANK